jgi:hypothetical protein
MELTSTPPEATISLEELQIVTQLGLLRLPTQEAETKRVTLMRALVAAEGDLNRALSTHTRCFLVNCQGSHGTGNLAYETEQLHAALRRYGELVQATVHALHLVDGCAVTEGRKGAASRETRAVSRTPKVALRRAV